MNKFLKRIKLLNNNWTNNSNFEIKSFREIQNKPVQLKALIKYDLETEVKKEKRFGKETPTCSSKCECQSKIKNYEEKFINNQDEEFHQIMPKQAKERKPNLEDKWTSIKREETYIEDCNTCKTTGELDCRECANCSGLPTGKTNCFSCFGSGKKNCFSCGGTGKSNNGMCLSCTGTGKSNCSLCFGSGRTTCNSCNGNLKVTCDNCEGHKYFTCSETLFLNVISHTDISWNEGTTPDWMNTYLNYEISGNKTHVDLMEYSQWHTHTFNLGSFEKEQFFASIQGNIEPFKVVYKDNNDTEYNCKYIHSSLVPYDMDYIFDGYINQICDNVIEKNALKYQKEFFKNQIIENIVDEKGDSIPSRSKMISLKTREKIKTTFKNFSEEHLEEQKNIDIRDIFNWTGISFVFIFFCLFLTGLFTNETIQWSLISLPNIAINLPNMINEIVFQINNFSLSTLGFLSGTAVLAFCFQKLLGSSKKSILRYLGWFFNTFLILFILVFNLNSHFSEIAWQLNLSNIGNSFNSVFEVSFDILLFSILIGILKARNINCFKMRNIAEMLNNDTLKSKLGY